MAGHIQDRWFRNENDSDGNPMRVKTERHGTGLRYRARYIGPDGTEKSKSFPDRQKRFAEQWLSNIEADMSRGAYVDSAAGRTTFRQYGEKWLAGQTTDMTTRTTVEVQLRRHAFPYIGPRPLDSFKPEHIREWLGTLETTLPKSSYRRVIFNTVSAVLTAAVEDGRLLKNPCRATSVRAPLAGTPRVRPWTAERVFAVRAALPERYRAMADAEAAAAYGRGRSSASPSRRSITRPDGCTSSAR